MKEYQGWDGRHFRRCPAALAIGTEEDMRLHLDDCDPETCELPHSCDCADRDEAVYWQAVNQRIDEMRGK